MDLHALDTWEFLARQGIRNMRLVSGGAEINFSCPFPGHAHGDENPSMYANVETTAMLCRGCKARCNAITFLADLHGVSRTIAKRWIREAFGIDFAEPVGGSMTYETEMRFAEHPDEPPPTLAPEAFLATIRTDYEDPESAIQYLLDRGLNLETLREFHVGYDYLADRPCWPARDVEGRLVGVKGRAWRDGQEPRFFVFGDRGERTRFGFHPYDPSDHVFGLDRARANETVVLVEAELDAMALWQAGVERPVATGMSYFSPRHAQLIIREASECIVYYDDDKAGHSGVWGTDASDGRHLPGVVDLLEPHISVRLVGPHDRDPMDLARDGDLDEALRLIEDAPSTLALSVASVLR